MLGQFNAGGAFGGTAMQQALSQSNQDLAGQLGRVSTNLRNADYDRQVGLEDSYLGRQQAAWGQDMQNRNTALGAIPGLNDQVYGNARALMNVGQQRQGLLQNALDMGYDEYRDARDWDVNRLSTLTNALGSINGGTVQQSGANPNYRSAGQNAYSTALSLAGAWMSSSRELKDTHGPADPDAMLKAVRGWNLDHWNYKGEDTPHIGTYAEDFNKSLGLPDKPVIEFPDMFGALTGAIQSLDKKVQAISGKEKGQGGGQNWFGETGKPRKVA